MKNSNMYTSIPTYSSQTKKWTYTDFETRDDFKQFVWSKFIPPGELKLHDTASWRIPASKFERLGYYCEAPVKSRDFIDYWNFEKEKCSKGVIIDEFFLSKYYYFWINFLPINNKKVNKLKFPDVWDSQYYFFIYEFLCELEYKYSVIVKKRQWGSTFQHLAILINDLWFQEGFINKVGASDEEYLKSNWAILEEYRTFLNTNTAWYRAFNPDKTLNWQQRWEVKKAGRKSFVGNSSILRGINLKVSPTKGVGGKNNKFYYEEAGITKTMNKTFQYIDPALKLGALTTGIFMAGGSVGELDQCDDLKRMAFDTDAYNILSVENVFEEFPEYKNICFFVPEYWSMEPFIDSDGNSMIEQAKTWSDNERERLKKAASPEEYRMYISQHPYNLTEAFAWRKDSIFSQAKLLRQQERVDLEKAYGTPVELEYNSTNGITYKLSDLVPIRKFPLGDKDDKVGCVNVWEFPDVNPKWLTYFAGIDPIATDKTTSSASLFSIFIFKNLVERTYQDEDKQFKTRLEGYKVVASYTGRYDDMKKTNEIAEKLIVWYNALAAVENNVPSFINHMQQKGLQRYLATKDQLSFVTELKTNRDVYSPWGFKMNNTIRTYFIDIINEYINEELDIIRDKNTGKVYRMIYGVERIPDYALLEELKQYHDKLNVDRFVAFGAGLALMKAFRKSNVGIIRVNDSETKEEYTDKVRLGDKNFVRHFGQITYTQTDNTVNKIPRKYFKNYN
jgi:hypothetical protein